jgi:hypothetical protein
VGAILGQDGNINDTGVHTITECKINDSVLTSERNGWLGPFLGEEAQSLALASS